MGSALPDKFRTVLDYLPCEACLEIPVEDQELHCSICRRVSRVVAVRTSREVAVVVEAPAVPIVLPVPDVEVPPAPAAALVEEPTPVALAAAEGDEEGADVGFASSMQAAEEIDEDIDIGFERTPPAAEPAYAEAEPAIEQEAPIDGKDFTFDPDTLEPEPEDELLREAEAWAEAAAEEEVELQPVTREELEGLRPLEPEPWPEEPPPAAEPTPEALEVLEVVEEQDAQPLEPDPLEAETSVVPVPPPPEPVETLEVLEVVEDEAPVEPGAPEGEVWEDEPWPEEVAPPTPVDASGGAEAPPPLEDADEAWAEPASPPAEAPVEDPVSRLSDVGDVYGEKLLAQGVQRVRDLAGRDAKALAKATGIDRKLVDRWVRAADLHQAGVSIAYAEAVVRAGYDSPRALRKARPDKVARDVNRVLSEGAAPLDADTVRAWQGAAG